MLNREIMWFDLIRKLVYTKLTSVLIHRNASIRSFGSWKKESAGLKRNSG